jgi:hypothetical protein
MSLSIYETLRLEMLRNVQDEDVDQFRHRQSSPSIAPTKYFPNTLAAVADPEIHVSELQAASHMLK